MPAVCISVPAPGLRRRLLALPLLTLLISPAFAGEGTYKLTDYYFCTSNPAPKTRYYSGVFDMTASSVVEHQAAAAFQQFLSAKYGIHAAANCQGSLDKKTAEAVMQQQVTQLKSVK